MLHVEMSLVLKKGMLGSFEQTHFLLFCHLPTECSFCVIHTKQPKGVRDMSEAKNLSGNY